MLARGEVGPDALGLRGRGPDRGGTADAGVIAADHRKNLHPADVASFEDAFGRTDIGKHRALAGRHDHQLEVFGALRVDPAGERRREFHLARSGPHGTVGVGDGLVGDPRQAA